MGNLGSGPMMMATLLTAALGLVIWFIVRRQKERYWLPILRVIPLELTVLPKFRWIPPPLWPLLCFFVAATALGIYSFRLAEPLMKSDDLDLRRTHVLFDMSPSHALGVTASTYGGEAQKLIDAMEGKARLSFSTTNDPTVYVDADLKRVGSIIQTQGFHRAGVKLGATAESLLRKLSDIDQLIVVSDSDLSSWEDFNWRYLEKKMQISWYPLPGRPQTMDNLFIDEAKPKATGSAAPSGLWHVTLRRTGEGKVIQGRLTAEIDGQVLIQQNFQFEANMKSLELEINLALAELQKKQKDKSTSLVWTVTPAGPDDLLPDNEFRTWLQLQNEDALIISKPRGEMFLEDSIFHLKTSLEVLGYQTQRIDQIRNTGSHWTTPSLVVSEVGPASPVQAFCPTFVSERSILERSRSDALVWLLPGEDLSSYDDICTCFAALAQAPQPLSGKPAYCENLEHRDQYVGVLQSIGALQLGGEVDSPLGALAMTLRNKELGLRLVGFTIPLNPLRAGQISYGQLPLMLRAVLQATGKKYAAGADKQLSWPRIEDISLAYEVPDVKVSNVPLGESLGRKAVPDQLPPQMTLGTKGLVREKAASGTENDARPWIYLCLVILMIAVWLEIIGSGLRRLLQKYPWAVRWFVLLVMVSAWPQPVDAGVQLNLLGYPSIPRPSALRKDVAGRTSIELDEQIINTPSLQRDMYQQPWLWVNRPQLLESMNKTDFGELTGWMQRGGFLVVENHNGSQAFKQAVLEAIPKGAWKPIPPDHELMRSFHLLASLPQCGNQVWEGFHFDQRIAMVLVPGDFLRFTLDEPGSGACFGKYTREQAVRVFINLMMVALATDYKKDQIHLPEILKRLR
ncbi:MAG TPA: DUF4159 domain-containing protein [Oligoflexus sp.]|uniref:DUF4159 domain-containing protein n=1 Tax=Oligoflexus sp. TaxID=1971216 RepID=UPI002D31095D|nr:DUF4159 domain-containing protein [Oligoflexus sp.]HYX39916.1 DUF4159 domain-containing protein [Oligoflexus sp.]